MEYTEDVTVLDHTADHTSVPANKTTSTPVSSTAQVDLTFDSPRKTTPSVAKDRARPTVQAKAAKQPEGEKKAESSGDQEGLQVAFMHSELTCIREHIEKISSIPQDLLLLRNSVESAQGDVVVLGTQCHGFKKDLASIGADLNSSSQEVNSVKTHIIGLRADTMGLKGDLHGVSKICVEGKIIAKGTKDEVSNARVDLVRVSDDVNTVKRDVVGLDSKVAVVVDDLASLKHEVCVIKSDVASIKRDVASFKTVLGTIACGVQALQSSIIQPGSASVGSRDAEINEKEIDVKTDPGTPYHEPSDGEQNEQDQSETVESLDTSEVSFKYKLGQITYENVRRTCKVVAIDSEIDAIPDTQVDKTILGKPQVKGDIVLSVPRDHNQEIPVSMQPYVCDSETQEESQSLLQRKTSPPAASAVDTSASVTVLEEQEAGPSTEEGPFTVLHEGRVDRDGKTFFVLETEADDQTQQATNMLPIINTTQNLPPLPESPKKMKKGRRKDRK